MDISKIIKKSPLSNKEYEEIVANFRNGCVNDVDYFVGLICGDTTDDKNYKEYKGYFVLDLNV